MKRKQQPFPLTISIIAMNRVSMSQYLMSVLCPNLSPPQTLEKSVVSQKYPNKLVLIDLPGLGHLEYKKTSFSV